MKILVLSLLFTGCTRAFTESENYIYSKNEWIYSCKKSHKTKRNVCVSTITFRLMDRAYAQDDIATQLLINQSMLNTNSDDDCTYKEITETVCDKVLLQRIK